jgi:hypothetical protein
MKKWICVYCGRRGETEDIIIIKICNCCQEAMKEIREKNNE